MTVATEKGVRELKAAREEAAFFDAAAWGQFLVSGPDAAAFLHRMLSNEVQKLKPAEGRYQGLLDRKGMTLSLFYLYRLGEQEFLAVTPPQLTEKTIAILSKMKFIEKLTLQDVSGDRGLLFLMGPKAAGLVESLALPSSLTVWAEDTFGLPWFNLSGPKADITTVRAALASRASELSDASLRLLRMSAGFPEYGIDLDETHVLLEAAVPVAHQRNKGCYPGQEVIEKIATYGKGRAPRRLVPFTIPGEQSLPRGSAVVLPDGTTAGRVTSSLFDPVEGLTRVMACLETKYLDAFLTNVGQCQFLPPASA